MNHEIIQYLTRLKKIYETIDQKPLKKEITNLEKIIASLLENENSTEPKVKAAKKNSFKENYQLIKDKNLAAMTGTKLDYTCFSCNDDVVNFIEKNDQAKLLRKTTALDLKLLYSLLTDNPTEIKGTKNDIYEAMKRNVRARKRGEAFMKTLK